jgi:probable addiction module antidote protein
MPKIETLPWDPAEDLETEAGMVAYLDAALGDGDPTVIAAVRGGIARAKGMTQIAESDRLLGRESLYRALSAEGNPEFATVLKVIRALGIGLSTHLQPSPLHTPSARQASLRLHF